MKKVLKTVLIILGGLLGVFTIIVVIALNSGPTDEERQAAKEKEEKEFIHLCDTFMEEFYKSKDLDSLYGYQDLIEKANKCISFSDKYSNLSKNFKAWEKGAEKNKLKIQEMELYYAIHGERPKNSESDVKYYLKQIANVPSSVSDVSCTRPIFGGCLFIGHGLFLILYPVFISQ